MSILRKSALGFFAIALMTTNAQALSIPTMPSVPVMPTLPTLPSVPTISAMNPAAVTKPVISVPRAPVSPSWRRGVR